MNEETASQICERLASGESLRTICQTAGFPDKSTVFRKLAVDKDFRDQYARAREAQMDAMAEEILDIADEEPTMTIDGENFSKTCVDPAGIQRNRLRADTRKWLMSKLSAKKYGDKVHTEVTGKDGGPIEANVQIQFVRTHGDGRIS